MILQLEMGPLKPDLKGVHGHLPVDKLGNTLITGWKCKKLAKCVLWHSVRILTPTKSSERPSRAVVVQ